MKPRSWAVFIGVVALLAITFGVGWGGSTLAGPAAARDTSVTVSQGLGNAAGPAAQSLASAAHPVPKRVGQGPKIPHGARRLGALSAAAKISVDVVLAPSNPAALADYAANVSSPGNALYHRYLTVSQFASMFGPSASAIAAVEASLRADGLTPGTLSANHLLLPVTATAKQFGGAFSTGFDQYQLTGGRVAFANTAAPLIAGAAAPYVSAVIGLNSLAVPQRLGVSRSAGRLAAASPQVVTGGPQPCAAATSIASQFGVYTADQVASAYGFSGLYAADDEGAGVTIGLLELEPNLPSDISTYQACYGTNATVTYIPEAGGPNSAGSVETALDIEDIIGLAPKAAINVYQSPLTSTGYFDSFNDMVDNSNVKVMSTSWGFCETDAESEGLTSSEDMIFQQAAIEGKTVFAASGDTGSTGCAPATSALAVDDPASQPWVTSVGGTSLTSVSPPAQTTWNDSAIQNGAGGGGVSSAFQMASYQSSAPAALNVINANSSGSPCGLGIGLYCREVPDVSASADPQRGYVIFYNGSWGAYGGTSAAAPLWAAFTALTDASSTCAGTAIGFANTLLYQAAATNYAANFTDITSGTNDYTPSGYGGGLYPATTGYDMATGLGTPKGATLAKALCSKGGAANTVTIGSLINQVTTVGATFSLQVTAADSGGAALTFAAAGLPPGLSVSSSGLISGSPSAAGTYPVTLTATDTTNASGSASFTISVNQASQSISFTAPVSGSVGGSATLSANGGGSGNPVVFSVDATSGSGVCSVSGSTVSYLAAGSCVIDADQAGNADYAAAPPVTQTITVDGAPAFVIDSPPLTAATGQPYDCTFTASGTPAPSYALASGAPSWLSVGASSGEVTGTPPSGTTSFSYAVTATNDSGTATAGPFTVTVSAAGTGTSTKADVSAALSCPASLTVGDTGTCTLTVANAGPATTGNVVAAVRLPAALSEVSCTSSCARHANVFSWTLAALASGDSAQFAVTVKANAAGKVTVLAAAVSQNCDPHPRNNISTQQIAISHPQGGKAPGLGRYPGHGGRGWPARRGGH
jgi:uncharacterized repeat protein (TIGR01451 family)